VQGHIVIGTHPLTLNDTVTKMADLPQNVKAFILLIRTPYVTGAFEFVQLSKPEGMRP
jgi:hypothetical protein